MHQDVQEAVELAPPSDTQPATVDRLSLDMGKMLACQDQILSRISAQDEKLDAMHSILKRTQLANYGLDFSAWPRITGLGKAFIPVAFIILMLAGCVGAAGERIVTSALGAPAR